jgi:hypothetical protein
MGTNYRYFSYRKSMMYRIFSLFGGVGLQTDVFIHPLEFSVNTSPIPSIRSSGLPSLTRHETGLMIAACLGLLAAIFGPSVAQPEHYHGFADQRILLGLPLAMDVLSNLPFAIAAIWGLLALYRSPSATQSFSTQAQPALAALFFGGLLVTAVCSGYYHLLPDNATLAIDRLGMVIAFAGLLGVAVADKVSSRAGIAIAALVLAAGPLTVGVWADSGNLLPWVLLQGGGMLLIALLAVRRPLKDSWGLQLLPVVIFYAAAKLLELGDHQVFEWTGGMISGHSLKHIVAAFAAWPVIAAIYRQRTRPVNSSR